AVGGVEPQTETVWRQADRYGVPRVIFVNKMDRVGADFDMCVNMVRDRLGAKPVPIQLPLGAGELFTGVVDLVRQIEIVYDDESLGKKYVEGPVPDSLKKKVAELRHQLLEAVVEHDDAILHKYLEGQPLTDDEVRAGDIAAPIGLKDTKTGDTLCDAEHPIILEAMRFPEPVISVAIEPKTKADQDKLGVALGKLSEEDPTFRVHTDPETAQTII